MIVSDNPQDAIRKLRQLENLIKQKDERVRVLEGEIADYEKTVESKNTLIARMRSQIAKLTTQVRRKAGAVEDSSPDDDVQRGDDPPVLS